MEEMIVFLVVLVGIGLAIVWCGCTLWSIANVLVRIAKALESN